MGGGQSTSGPIYEKWGGSPFQVPFKESGGAVHFRSHLKKVGGSPHQVRYTKSGGGGGGGQFASGPIRKVGGGGPVRFRSDTFVWHTENTLSLIINGYNFDQGGARANELNCRF